ncbi:MAG: hypothetical protein IPK16_23655 [Anaerolineales bacterium]|nr:hypothetical protein [Anaerolineales bacterium]
MPTAAYDLQPADNTASIGLVVKTTSLQGTVTDVETGAPLVGVTIRDHRQPGQPLHGDHGADGVYAVTSGQNGQPAGAGRGNGGGNGRRAHRLSSCGQPPRRLRLAVVNTGNLTLVLPSLSGV